MTAEELRAELIAVLQAARAPLSTTAARLAVIEHHVGGRPAVAEEVYRALLVLQRHGVVRRVHDQPGRLAHWELAMLVTDGIDGRTQ